MKIKKKVQFYKHLRWAGIIFGIIMYLATEGPFGEVWAAVLCMAAAFGFSFICTSESRRILCQYVADDLKTALTAAGYPRCAVEIRSISAGLIARVYLIDVGNMAAVCNRAVQERINKNWYRGNIWVTQLLEVKNESEITEARLFLDEMLYEDVRRKRSEMCEHEKDDRDRSGRKKREGRKGK